MSDRTVTPPITAAQAARVTPGPGTVVHRKPLTVVVATDGDIELTARGITEVVDTLVADGALAFGPVAAGLQQFVVDHQPTGVAAVLDVAPDAIAFLFDQAVAIGDATTHRASGRSGWTTVFVEGQSVSLVAGPGPEHPVDPWSQLWAGTVAGQGVQVDLQRLTLANEADEEPQPEVEPEPEVAPEPEPVAAAEVSPAAATDEASLTDGPDLGQDMPNDLGFAVVDEARASSPTEVEVEADTVAIENGQVHLEIDTGELDPEVLTGETDTEASLDPEHEVAVDDRAEGPAAGTFEMETTVFDELDGVSGDVEGTDEADDPDAAVDGPAEDQDSADERIDEWHPSEPAADQPTADITSEVAANGDGSDAATDEVIELDDEPIDLSSSAVPAWNWPPPGPESAAAEPVETMANASASTSPVIEAQAPTAELPAPSIEEPIAGTPPMPTGLPAPSSDQQPIAGTPPMPDFPPPSAQATPIAGPPPMPGPMPTDFPPPPPDAEPIAGPPPMPTAEARRADSDESD